MKYHVVLTVKIEQGTIKDVFPPLQPFLNVHEYIDRFILAIGMQSLSWRSGI